MSPAELDAVTIGPGEVLILRSRRALDPEAVDEIRAVVDRIAELKGRVLVVSPDIEVTVAKAQR